MLMDEQCRSRILPIITGPALEADWVFPQFVKLPPELQNKIWLFTTQNPLDIEITQYNSDTTKRIAKHMPALLHTC